MKIKQGDAVSLQMRHLSIRDNMTLLVSRYISESIYDINKLPPELILQIKHIILIST